MLEIKTKLSTSFHTQIDGQTKHMNQELEQYLQFFIDHRQKNWLQQLVIAKFAVNNKIHLATKVFLFMMNHDRELKIRANIMKSKKDNKVCKKNKKDIRKLRQY